MRMFAEVQEATSEPVGDHERERMFGTRYEGLFDVFSVNSTGFKLLKAVGKASFLSGFERRGGAIVWVDPAGGMKSRERWRARSAQYYCDKSTAIATA